MRESQEAIKKIEDAIAAIEDLKHTKAYSDAHTRWLSNTLTLLEMIVGPGSRIFCSFESLPWHKTGPFLVQHVAVEGQKAIDRVHHKEYLRQLDVAKGLLLSAIDQIQAYGVEQVFRGAKGPEESNEILTLIDLMKNKLRKTIRDVPGQEKEIQDQFEDLLLAKGIKYLREGEKVPFSSKTYHPDFSFPEIGTVLEVKLCNRAEKEKEIIAQINDDIRAYKTRYPNLLFLVYSTGIIRDADKFTEDIEAEDGVMIEVVRH